MKFGCVRGIMTSLCPGCGEKQSENGRTYAYCDYCDNWVCEECECDCGKGPCEECEQIIPYELHCPHCFLCEECCSCDVLEE